MSEADKQSFDKMMGKLEDLAPDMAAAMRARDETFLTNGE